jgi:RNA polymerase sigma-70 factor, ECF subfamily
MLPDPDERTKASGLLVPSTQVHARTVQSPLRVKGVRDLTTHTVPERIGDLYAREGPRIWRAVFAYCQDRAITDDAVAEAFAQCLRRGTEVRDSKAWVWMAAFRLAAGELKERSRARPVEVEPTYELSEPADRLIGALRLLPGNQRACVVLHDYVGYGSDEVARIIGVSRATVRVHLSRGRRRLRELLGGPDDDV